MNRVFFYIALALGSAAFIQPQPVNAQLPTMDSECFMYGFEVNIDPAQGGGEQFRKWLSGASNTLSGGIMTMSNVANNYYDMGAVVNSTSWWNNVSYASGFTVEARLMTNQAGANSSCGIEAHGGGAGSPYSAAYLHISDTSLIWGGALPGGTTIATGLNNNGAFHTYRIAKLANQDSYTVWRDGVQIASGLTSAYGSSTNYLAFGACTTNERGANQIDYIRFNPGAYAPAAATELSRGRQIILDKGLQTQSLVFNDAVPGMSNCALWLAQNYRTINFWENTAHHDETILADPLMAGQYWSRIYTPGSGTWCLTSTELNYVNNLASLQYGDDTLSFLTPSVTNQIANQFRWWNQNYPGALVLWDGKRDNPNGIANVRTCMQATHPDVLCFNDYPGFGYPQSNRDRLYGLMQTYRTVGLEGWDGTGTKPIPYGMFLDLYRSSYTAATPSQSFVHMQQFASMAFGYTYLAAFVYNGATSDPAIKPVSFNADGDDPAHQEGCINYIASANTFSRRYSYPLVRLKSTGIWMHRGYFGSSPIPEYTQYQVSWLSDVTRVSGVTRDILIGRFTNLRSSNTDFPWIAGEHFMVVNAAHDGTTIASTATLRLTFSGLTAGHTHHLDRYDDSGTTGQVINIPLTTPTGTTSTADVSFGGGVGYLFKFVENY